MSSYPKGFKTVTCVALIAAIVVILLLNPPVYVVRKGEGLLVRNLLTGNEKFIRGKGYHLRIPLLEVVEVVRDPLNLTELEGEIKKVKALYGKAKKLYKPIFDEEYFKAVFQSTGDREKAAIKAFEKALREEAENVIKPYLARHFNGFFGGVNIPYIAVAPFERLEGKYGVFIESTNTVYISTYFCPYIGNSSDERCRYALVHEIVHAQGVVRWKTAETDAHIITLEAVAEIAKEHSEYKPSLYRVWLEFLRNVEKALKSGVERRGYSLDTYVKVKLALKRREPVYLSTLRKEIVLDDLATLLADVYGGG